MTKSTFGFKSPEDSPGFLLWQTTTIWQRYIKRLLEEHDLSHAQFVIMALLLWFKEQKVEVTQIDIAHRSRLDKMTVSKSLKKLVGLDLVGRKECLEDSRAKSVFLTAKGIRKVKKLVPLVEVIDKEFFGVIKSSDRKYMVSVLKILSED